MFQKPYIKTRLHFTVIVYRQLSATKLLSSVEHVQGTASVLPFPAAAWQEQAACLSLVSNYKDSLSCNYPTD